MYLSLLLIVIKLLLFYFYSPEIDIIIIKPKSEYICHTITYILHDIYVDIKYIEI